MSALSHLRLKKHQHLHIFWHLVLNGLLHLKLRLMKCVKGIKKPIIHYYAVCWNEEKMIPFVLDYYGRFVEHFFFYDNYSTDHTKDIIATVTNASLIPFGKEGQFDDSANQKVKNNAWKKSRGHADFVVVCDMDEFLYHPEMIDALAKLRKQHISIPRTRGFEMYCDSFPEHRDGLLLTDMAQKGIRDEWYDKFLVFDPYDIVEMNYAPGAHEADPIGIVRYADDALFKVLHYKNLGVDYLISRYQELGKRLSAFNLENHMGTHYLEEEEKKRAEMQHGLAQAKNVVTDD